MLWMAFTIHLNMHNLALILCDIQTNQENGQRANQRLELSKTFDVTLKFYPPFCEMLWIFVAGGNCIWQPPAKRVHPLRNSVLIDSFGWVEINGNVGNKMRTGLISFRSFFWATPKIAIEANGQRKAPTDTIRHSLLYSLPT